MRARTLTGYSALAALLALGGCDGPVLFAELEMPSVEVTVQQQTFSGTGTAGSIPVTTVSFDIGANVPVIDEPNVEAELVLRSMTLVLGTTDPSDPNSFDGIDLITIRALPPPSDPSRPAIVLLEWVNPHTNTEPLTSVTARSQTDADLSAWLQDGTIVLEASYEGSALPYYDWTADLTGDFSLSVKLDYGAYL